MIKTTLTNDEQELLGKMISSYFNQYDQGDIVLSIATKLGLGFDLKNRNGIFIMQDVHVKNTPDLRIK